MMKNTLKRRTRTVAAVPSFFAEPLEARMLLSGSLLVDSVALLSLNGTEVTNGQLIPDGAAVSASAGVGHSNDGSNGQGAYLSITGDVIWQWYGGAELVDLPLTPDGTGRDYGSSNNGVTCVLNESAAGPAIPSGPYKGDHLLEYYYTGDANWAPTPQVTAANYQSLLAGNGLGNPYALLLKFSGASTQSKLAFIQNPSNTAASDTIAPPVTVAVEDSSGNFTTSASDTVTLAIASGSGALSGTLSEPAVNGIATFSNLSIDQLGSYTLTASDTTTSSTTAATSSLFHITGGKLVFLPPKLTGGNAGDPLQPDIKVALEDGKGKIDTTNSSTVVTLSPIGFTSGNPITGNSATLVNGIATFSNVVLTKPGTYQLQAADGGDTTSATNKFKVAGDHLAFKLQPVDTSVNAALTLTVAIENAKNQVNTSDNQTAVNIEFDTLANGASAQLLGSTVVIVVNGIATFSAAANVIKFDTLGTYQLTADDGTDPVITSKPIEVKGSHLKFSIPPRPSNVNQPLQFAITEEDASNKVVTTDDSSAISITVVNATTGAAAQYTVQSAVTPVLSNGVINYGNAQIVTIDQAGTFDITATAVLAIAFGGVLTPIPTIAPVTFKNLKITGFKLAFLSRPPSTNTINQPIPFTIEIKDAKNAINRRDNSTGLEFSVTPFGGAVNNSFITNVPVPVLAGGEAVFDATDYFKISEIGKFSITVTAIDPTNQTGNNLIATTSPVTSPVFSVKGYHLAFIARVPSKSSVNQPIPFTVAIEDSSKNINHSDNTTGLEISLKTYTGGNINNSFITNTPIPVLVNGEAVFDVNHFLEFADAGKYSLTITAIDPSDSSVIDSVDPATSSVFIVTA